MQCVNKKSLCLHLGIIPHQLLFNSADILNLTREDWAAGKANVLIGIEGRHDWGLMKAVLFFPQILFFHVLEFLFSPFYGEFLVFHMGSRMQVVVSTFPIDVLWTEFVNQSMSSDTQKFLETRPGSLL